MRFIFLAIFLALPAQAALPSLLSCPNILLYQPQEDGAVFLPSHFSVYVAPSTEGVYGWEAKVNDGTRFFKETDVAVTEVSPDEAGFARDIAARVAPDLRWEEVHSVIYGNVGVEANLDDAAGMGLFELYDARGHLLAKLAHIGWSLGVCGEAP